uniref:Uncharacterized protein n=2 Tax=Magnoliopsida TaxID=3398 RepID=A0A803L6L8_CHEQI
MANPLGNLQGMSATFARRLTEAELQERGPIHTSSFRCDDKWGVGHRCKRKEMSVLMVVEEDETPESEDNMAEEAKVEVSLCSIIGISNPKTMKSKGTLGGRSEVVMIDRGATHNFIALKFVAKMAVPVSKGMERQGYNIGVRLIDEFLAKSNVSRCVDFKETAEVIAKVLFEDFLTDFMACEQVGFKMFLGVSATVTNWDAEGTTCSLVLEDNPLVDFVELPDTCQGLHYCNVLNGVVRGALEMVSMKTEVTWIRDMLRGDDAYELQVKLLKQIPEEYPYKDDE